jgi:teichuronic acid biosynthesis glycosyltransferase TuaH
MIDRADLILATSEAVLQKVQEQRRDGVHLIEHGVDFQRFRAFAGTLVPPPTEMQDLHRPIVGYIGRINRKVDLTVLIDIAVRRPKWSVVLMGPILGFETDQAEAFRKFVALPNARYIPARPHTDLPRYMNALDVGLMNYVTKDTWVPFGFPLKMFEYFAMGKPGVCTDLVSVRKYAPPLILVPDQGDWVSAVEQALATATAETVDGLVTLAMENSWNHRCVKIVDLLNAYLDQRRFEANTVDFSLAGS